MSYRESKINYDKLRKMIDSQDTRIHFIGIGGVSVYSLARLVLSYNKSAVSGSDLQDTDRTATLRELGAKIFIGHSPDNVKGADLVVYTHAIAEDNPELLSAQRMGIPTVTRASLLGAVMLDYGSRIGVSGSHGKSTTVAMLDAIFTTAGREPSVFSGAELSCGEPMKLSSKQTLIYEACEYKDSFLRFSPTLAVALNLEYDHTDYFPDIRALRESFITALSRAGKAIVNYDDENLYRIIRKIKTRVVTFGQGDEPDYQYKITAFRDRGCDFTLSYRGRHIGNFTLNIPGVFNVSNAAAAIVTALESGIAADTIAEGLAGFSGISRRLEYIGDRYGRRVFYDYAHHPTEIRCVINTVRMLFGDSVTVVFKPHTFTRTRSLWDGFISALGIADYAVLLDIYPAREAAIEGITSERLAFEIGKGAVRLTEQELLSHIDKNTYGDIILMGAGDMEESKNLILDT